MKNKRPMAAIFGVAATTISNDERSFFRDSDPLGFIVFARNIENPDQLRALTDEMREITGRDNTPVLVDQEGGRVARLGSPHWPAFPPAARYGELFAVDPEAGIEAAHLGGQLIGNELALAGISVDCAPVLDVPQPGADPIIGDRAFAGEPGAITALARAFADGLMETGIVPVIKHIPGHGRANVDSHEHLPVVDSPMEDLETDFAPFRALNYMPWAMTAHVVFSEIDPELPVTLSGKAVSEIVRRKIGFRGFLVSDDLSMKALGGPFDRRAEMALDAGCDSVLHCNGDMDEMVRVASGAREMTGPQWARFALGDLQHRAADESEGIEIARQSRRLDELLARLGS